MSQKDNSIITLVYDFLYDFCIFCGGQPRGVKMKNAYFYGFFDFFSPRVNYRQWVQVPPAPPNKPPTA